MFNTQSVSPRVTGPALRGEDVAVPPTETITSEETLDLDRIPFKVFLAWLNSVEAETPGVSQSMSAATAAAAFIAAAKTFGAHTKLHRLRLSPPPGLVLQLSDAVSKMTASLSRNTTGAVPPSAHSTGRKPDGKRRQTTKPRTSNKRSGKAAPAADGRAEKSVKPKSAKPAESVSRDPRKNILAKALRSFRGTGVQANLARRLGLTEELLRERIQSLSEADILSRRRTNSPALAYTGVFDDVKRWGDEAEKDEWLTQVARRQVVPEPVVVEMVNLEKTFSVRPSVRTAAEQASAFLKSGLQSLRVCPWESGKFLKGGLPDSTRVALRQVADGQITVNYKVVKADSVSSPATVNFTCRIGDEYRLIVKGTLYLHRQRSGMFIVTNTNTHTSAALGGPPLTYEPRKRVMGPGVSPANKAGETQET